MELRPPSSHLEKPVPLPILFNEEWRTEQMGSREGSETHTLCASGSSEVRTTHNIASFRKLKEKERQMTSSPAVMKDGLSRSRPETPQVRGVYTILVIDVHHPCNRPHNTEHRADRGEGSRGQRSLLPFLPVFNCWARTSVQTQALSGKRVKCLCLFPQKHC